MDIRFLPEAQQELVDFRSWSPDVYAAYAHVLDILATGKHPRHTKHVHSQDAYGYRLRIAGDYYIFWRHREADILVIWVGVDPHLEPQPE